AAYRMQCDDRGSECRHTTWNTSCFPAPSSFMHRPSRANVSTRIGGRPLMGLPALESHHRGSDSAKTRTDHAVSLRLAGVSQRRVPFHPAREPDSTHLRAHADEQSFSGRSLPRPRIRALG